MKKFLFVIMLVIVFPLCVSAEEPTKAPAITYTCEQTGIIQITFPVMKQSEMVCLSDEFGCPNQRFEDTFKKELSKITIGQIIGSPTALDMVKIQPAVCKKKEPIGDKK